MLGIEHAYYLLLLSMFCSDYLSIFHGCDSFVLLSLTVPKYNVVYRSR